MNSFPLFSIVSLLLVSFVMSSADKTIREENNVDQGEIRRADCGRCYTGAAQTACLNLLSSCVIYQQSDLARDKNILYDIYDELSTREGLVHDLYCMCVQSYWIEETDAECEHDIGSVKDVILSSFSLVLRETIPVQYGETNCLSWDIEDPLERIGFFELPNSLITPSIKFRERPYTSISWFQNENIAGAEVLMNAIDTIQTYTWGFSKYFAVENPNEFRVRRVSDEDDSTLITFRVEIPLSANLYIRAINI